MKGSLRYVLWPLYLLYKVYMLVIFFVVWAVFYPFVHFKLKDRDRHPEAFRIKVLWCKVLAFFWGNYYVIHGRENLFFDGPCVVCINHQSYSDIIHMYPVIPYYFKFIGKKELRKWLMIGVFFRKGMDISINRENAKEAMASLDEARAALRSGVSVAIFPEGEIPNDTPQLKRFKNGAFKIALEETVPILPITFLYNHERLEIPHRIFGKATPGKCEVIVHPRVDTQGMDMMDLSPLRNKIYDIINAPLIERGLSQSPNFVRNEDR
ncbi:MAG: 1-acyl-sn-glycerol-3-phosphate acyltransferase [Flavobacteriales bacterium]|nr:1-acyl-sn-glycerol-3-phosphate acyltransferase [Flavobacteriales bacterium]